MKYSFVVFCFILITPLAFAQNDKVYLKNGSKILGVVTKYFGADTILVKVGEGEITLPLHAVEEIRFKKREFGRPDKYKDLSYEQGHYKTFKAGAMVGNHSYNDPFKIWLMLEGLYEYYYHPLLNGGVGAGISFYDRYIVFPLYAQYQAVLSRKNRSLFVYAQAGHGFAHANDSNDELKDVDSGRLFAGGIGFQKKVGIGFFKYQLGFNSQRVTEVVSPVLIWGWPRNSEDHAVRKRDMNRLVFSVSYSF